MIPTRRPRRLLSLFMATAVALLVLDLAGFGPINTVRRTVLTIGQPIGAVLAFVVSPIAGTWNGAVHVDDLEQENHALRRRVAELEGAMAGQNDARLELAALLAATEIEYLGDVERTAARVVADRTTDFERVVEIDKGSDHGVAPGMAVVTGRGLVGTVELVVGDRSVVRLITDVEVAVGVRTEDGLGLATGSADGAIGLEATPELAEAVRVGVVGAGARFVTSGVDRSLFPAGIPVGTLVVPAPLAQLGEPEPGGNPGSGSGSDVDERPSPAGPMLAPDGSPHDPAIGLTIRPLAELDRLGFVTVLLIEPST
jgi:rod shape-determining protein MreC